MVIGCLKKKNEMLPHPRTPCNADSQPQLSEIHIQLSGAGPRDLHFFKIPGGSDAQPGVRPVTVTTGGEAQWCQRTGVSRALSLQPCWAKARLWDTSLLLCGQNTRTLMLHCTGRGPGPTCPTSPAPPGGLSDP